jgi:DNA-binding NarL/FixJ family response regulator
MGTSLDHQIPAMDRSAEEPQHPVRLIVAEDSYVIREFLTTALSRVPDPEVVAVCTTARNSRRHPKLEELIVDVLIQTRCKAATSKLSELTAREHELLAEIASGKSNSAIAASLVLTKRAVEKHVKSIFSKLNLTETQDISRRARRR